jgi:hypothetical protein
VKIASSEFFLDSENQGGSQNEKFFKKRARPGQFLKPAPKAGTDSSHKKVRTA